MGKYILALDQGTTSSRAILFDREMKVCASSQREFTQIYPKEGWVEHDANEIWATQYGVMREAIAKCGADHDEAIHAIGITNQRETVVVWDKNTGMPVYNAIVWQCRRTAPICEELKEKGLTDYIKKTTGLLVDAYFSGTKIKWILDNVPGARERAEKGELLAGTIDCWLVWKLTDGRVHATDRTNASRTMLYDINNLCWDEKICGELGIPMCMLPEVKSSSEIYGEAIINGRPVPIAGIAGDQQSALFGQKCFNRGDVKNTYGTGCFMLVNTGDKPLESRSGLLTTIAASGPEGARYALEGSVFVAGAVVQWLRDEMNFVRTAAETEEYAKRVPDTAGVYVVPAFTGLGAPYWDMYARGAIVGITRGANRDHIIRAALESIAYQTNSVLRAMQEDLGTKINALRVDGGAAANDFLMQFQADISDLDVIRPAMLESTALGAALLAGLATGFWTYEEVSKPAEGDTTFSPFMVPARREELVRGFEKAVTKAKDWAEE